MNASGAALPCPIPHLHIYALEPLNEDGLILLFDMACVIVS